MDGIKTTDFLGNAIYDTPDPDLLADLGFDVIMKDIVKDGKDLRIFLDVASRKVADPYEAARRRDILAELVTKRDVCRMLKTMLAAPSKMIADYTHGKGNGGNIKEKLRSASLLVLRMNAWLHHCSSVVRTFDFVHPTLRSIIDRLVFLAESDELSDITSLCDTVIKRGIPNEPYCLCYELDSAGEVISADISLSADEVTHDKTKSFDVSSLEMPALCHITTLLESFAYSVSDEFSQIVSAFRYFSAAIDYVEYLETKGVNYSFVQLYRDCPISLTKYYPLELLKSKKISKIRPIDFQTKMVGFSATVSGEKGSGRSVFARAMATAALLSHIGLPVPAESAVMPFFKGVKVIAMYPGSHLWAENTADRLIKLLDEMNTFTAKGNMSYFVMCDGILDYSAYDGNRDLHTEFFRSMMMRRDTILDVLDNELPEFRQIEITMKKDHSFKMKNLLL